MEFLHTPLAQYSWMLLRPEYCRTPDTKLSFSAVWKAETPGSTAASEEKLLFFLA
jgi:hypothetical protein